METKTLAIIDGKEYRLPETEEEFAKLDRMEDEAIFKELTGDLSRIYIYSFETGGKKVTDLSVYGVDMVALGYGSIKTGIEKLITDGPDYVAVAYATDKLRDLTRIGSFSQPKRYATGKEDPFACTKATRKAERNALKELFPVPLKRGVILRAIADQEKVDLITLQEGIKQRIKDYNFNFEKFDKICQIKHGAPFLELDLEKAQRAGAFIVTVQAKRELS